MVHDGMGAVPGIKDSEDQWDLRPHRNRVVMIDQQRLSMFASLLSTLTYLAGLMSTRTRIDSPGSYGISVWYF